MRQEYLWEGGVDRKFISLNSYGTGKYYCILYRHHATALIDKPSNFSDFRVTLPIQNKV